MTVSIVVTTYNRPGLLASRCIPSVLAQTDPDWECHVVGDGTDPETCDYMAGLVASDRRFRFTNLEHAGADLWGLRAIDALNRGLDDATGDWISVLADDDEYTPHHNELLVREALARGVDFMYGISESPRGQRWGAWPPGDGQIANGAYVYRGAALAYRYDPRCIADRGLNGDADMWTRMFADGVSFGIVREVVHHYFPSSERG